MGLRQFGKTPISLQHKQAPVTYNLQMDKDETLEEFVQILGRIKELVGEAKISGDEAFDLVKAIEQLRQSGNGTDADELAALVERADQLKAQHQPKP